MSLVVVQTERDADVTDPDSAARRDAWATVETDALLREAQPDEW